MRIDFISATFLAAVAFSSVPLAQSLNVGLVGLGLTYTVSLAGMFQYCVRLSAEVENVVSGLVWGLQEAVWDGDCDEISSDLYALSAVSMVTTPSSR